MVQAQLGITAWLAWVQWLRNKASIKFQACSLETCP